MNDTLYYVAKALRNQDIILNWDEDGIVITTITVEIIAEYDWVPPKTQHVGKAKARD